ncbi:MAG: DUF5110 domain-containing protein [Ruminococcaceae bacterium]|nr:DUF5110 domain-containing protein [Oscillospiraceae bacterium]
MESNRLSKPVTREYSLASGLNIRVQFLTDRLFRFSYSRKNPFPEPLLNRYRFIEGDWAAVSFSEEETDDAWLIKTGETRLSISKDAGDVVTLSPVTANMSVCRENQGFSLTMPLHDKDRLFGLGDENRDAIMKRGRRATLWARNVSSYIPIPYLASSRGWAILVNTTFKHHYDLGATQSDRLDIRADDGPCDFYLMFAEGLAGLLDLYTRLTGRPTLLPRYAFGYMFICNEQNDARAMLDDARLFRERQIPCDSVGLEPDWMEKHYDFSVDKKWHPDKFYIPYWIRDMRRYHRLTFLGALHRLGFRLSLWLCCDYDLLWEEEKSAYREEEQTWNDDAKIQDDHFSFPVRMDKLTVPGQAWYEHLKPFVDQGVSAFKLDASSFIMEHPDRLWADRYHDREVHNLLPLVYGRQMSRSYTAQTGERAMINIPMGYAGIQHYCATWAGDTGGGAKPLVSMLNLGHCGVSSTSCDIEVTEIKSIHFGFLQAWTQQNNWNYWLQPWLLGDDLEEAVRFYAQLRSSLFPYLYSYAHVAYETGLPLMRSMPLAWPETDQYDDVMTQYMLGDALLVTAFSDQAVLPAGDWYDFWTDERLQGGQTIAYTPPEDRGGGLFARAGSIVIRQPWSPSLERYRPDCLDLHVYTGGDFTLVLSEDDGITEQYRSGAVARTELQLQEHDQVHMLRIGRRIGTYEGMGPVPALRVFLHGCAQPRVRDASGAAVALNEENGLTSFLVSAEKHQEDELSFMW